MEDSWHCTVNAPTKLYAARALKVCGFKKTIYMHRVIIGGDALEVDHIDGNCLNNTKSNLRSCTHAQNISNQKRPAGVSGFRGVYWKVHKKRWRSSIRKDGKTISIGEAFKTKTDAALAYNSAALKLFGEFAHLNQIPE